MSNYVSTAGGWLGKGWERLTEGGWEGLGMDMVRTTWGDVGAMYDIIKSSGEDWQSSQKEVETEEERKKKEMNDLIDKFNTPIPLPAPPEEPTEEGGGGESYQLPTYTSNIATPKINKQAKTYTPRRTSTILNKAGDVASQGKGKKRLLGE